MSELTDWVWLVVVVFWVLTRVLPRLFGRHKAPRSGQRMPQPTPPGGPVSLPGNTDSEPPVSPGPQIDPRTLKQVRSAAPIEPR